MNLKIVIEWIEFQKDKLQDLYRCVVGDMPKAIKHNDVKNWYEQLWRILKWRWHKKE